MSDTRTCVATRAGLVRGLAAALLALGLAACEATPPPRAAYPELTYGHHGAIDLDVARIEFATTYVPPLRAPNVEHRSPANPITVMERWTRDRLRAAGAAGEARVVLTQASIVESPLAVQGGLRGMFTTDQAVRYDAQIQLELQIRDAAGVQRGFTQARAERSRTVPENATLAEREKVLFDLVEATMTEINAEFDRSIRQFLGRFVRN